MYYAVNTMGLSQELKKEPFKSAINQRYRQGAVTSETPPPYQTYHDNFIISLRLTWLCR